MKKNTIIIISTLFSAQLIAREGCTDDGTGAFIAYCG